MLSVLFREDALTGNIEGENIIRAKQLMDDTVAQLFEHKKKVSYITKFQCCIDKNLPKF